MACLIETGEQMGFAFVRVVGDLDGGARDEFESKMLAAAGSTGFKMVADLMRVEYAESSPLGSLIKVDVELAERGGGLAVMCCNERLTKLMRLSGLDAQLHFFRDADRAVEYLSTLRGHNARGT